MIGFLRVKDGIVDIRHVPDMDGDGLSAKSKALSNTKTDVAVHLEVPYKDY